MSSCRSSAGFERLVVARIIAPEASSYQATLLARLRKARLIVTDSSVVQYDVFLLDLTTPRIELMSYRVV